MKYTNRQIENLFKSIYEGLITVDVLPEDLYFAIADYLKKSLYDGFGGTLTDFEMGSKDLELLTTLRENVYIFSGAKTYSQIAEMSSLIASSGSFHEFKQSVLKVYNQYNEDWLKAEYNTARGQAEQANQWNKYESEQALFPYLRYIAVMDKNTSDICRPLNGITLPINAAFWNIHAPLNHFNCRCTFERLDKYENVKLTSDTRIKSVTKEMSEKIQPEFKMNSGKDGYIFSPKHPYFTNAPKDKGKNNFGLPIPEND